MTGNAQNNGDKAESAIKQIKERNYPKVFENYLENLLLVGVNYDKDTKVHECVIEKYYGQPVDLP